MKNLIIKIATLIAIMFGFSGCAGALASIVHAVDDKAGTTKTEEGINIPREAVLEQNKNTKVYFEDLNYQLVRNDLTKLVDYLNSNDELLPNLWCIIENQEESKNDLSLAKIKCNENTSKKIEGITFKLDEKSNYIVANKTYSSPIDAYTDFLNIRQFIFSKLNKEEKLRDSFGTSSMTYGNHKSFKDNVLSFTTSREKARESIGDKVKKQVEAGGWIMVDNPKDADKTLTFSLSRGFSGAELEKLKKEKKDVKRDVYISINEKREHSFSVRSIHDFYNDINTNVHTHGNTNSSGAGVGIGAAFIVVDMLATSKARKMLIPQSEYLFPAVVVTQNNKSNLRVYNYGMIFDSKEGIGRLLNTVSAQINQWPEEKWNEVPLN